MKTQNPLLEEIWKIKEDLAGRDNHDVGTLFRRLRDVQRASKRKYVEFLPQPVNETADVLHDQPRKD